MIKILITVIQKTTFILYRH